MAASSVTLSGGSSEEILAANSHRDFYTLQLQTAEPVYLAFGEDAANATGIVLLYPGCSVRVTGVKAREAAYGFAADTPTIGIETSQDIEYRPGCEPA
jgi:hypothetical protein